MSSYRLQIGLNGVWTKVLSVRPADTGKEQADLFEVGIIFKPLEEIFTDIGGDIKDAGETIGKNNSNFFPSSGVTRIIFFIITPRA